MIEIVEYNPAWPAEFEAICAALHSALGPLALRVDHIGSTAVPGLSAKDVIDVQVTVAALSREVAERLRAAGFEQREMVRYDHVPPGAAEDPRLWAKLFFNQPAGQRRANIHVRVAGNPNQRYPLLFRDYLRAHPHSAAAIDRVKRAIAGHHADDIEAYYDIKDPVYDLIWDAAQEPSMTSTHLERWHNIVFTRDLTDLQAMLAEDVVFRSPYVWRPYQGRPAAWLILSTVIDVFQDFAYHRELVDGNNWALEFSARLGDRSLKGIDLIRLNDAGLIVEFEVFIRPFNGLQALGEEMARRLSLGADSPRR